MRGRTASQIADSLEAREAVIRAEGAQEELDLWQYLSINEVCKRLALLTLRRFEGNRAKTANALGISYTTLVRAKWMRP